jgi:hypothetical protein
VAGAVVGLVVDTGVVDTGVVGVTVDGVVGCWTGAVLTGAGFLLDVIGDWPAPFPCPVPTPRLGVVATMPAGTGTCVGLALAGAILLAVGAGDVTAGLAGDKSLVALIG